MPHAPTKQTKLRTPKKSARKKQTTQDAQPAEGTESTPPRVWTNQEVAQLLDRIGDILAIQGENRFKIIAYQRAADVIEHSTRGVQDVWAGDRDNLTAIPGVGEALADKLDELFRTGKMSYYEKISAQ